MKKQKYDWLSLSFLGIVGFLVWFSSMKLLYPPYLTFSDAAKFADIARNIVGGNGFGAGFAPFSEEFLKTPGLLPIASPPFLPLLLSAGFKIFGVNDWVVIFTSALFYFASGFVLYLLGKRLFGKIVGILASLVFLFDPAMINYAVIGASESLFIFELLLASLMFSINTKRSSFFGFLALAALYFTRPSAIIYIFGLVLFFIFLNFRSRNSLLKIGGIILFIWLFFEFISAKFSNGYLFYSPIKTFFYGAAKFSPETASTETLRGGMLSAGFQFKPFLSKFFYHLYNFYKLLPQIFSPYLFSLYVLSIIRWDEKRELILFRGLVIYFVLATFFASAASLPLYRYLHPVAPFVYLLGIEFVVWLLRRVYKEQRQVVAVAAILVFIFIGGQTVGKIFLDSRFENARLNRDKPPVYVKLAKILKENTKTTDYIVTNLDTWGTWYGKRKTIWFPIEPNQLVPKEGTENEISAIYLTSYKMDDSDYFMGDSWRKMFLNPENLENEYLAENFKLAGKYEVPGSETYEGESASAVLFVRK